MAQSTMDTNNLIESIDARARGGVFAARTLARARALLLSVLPFYSNPAHLSRPVLSALFATLSRERGRGKSVCVDSFLARCARAHVCVCVTSN